MIFPHTESRRVVLHPARAGDQAQFVQTLLRTGLESFRPAARGNRAGTKAHAAFVVRQRTSGEALGFGTLHGLDPAGHIRCSAYLEPKRARLGVGSEAIFLLVNYAFATLNISKVIAQTTEASFSAFGFASDNDEGQKGVLRDHLFFRGQHWDLHSFQIERGEWEKFIDENMDGVLPPPLTWRAAPQSH